jgi:arginase
MQLNSNNIQIISAPSVLGLTPGGVEQLADSLLQNGLAAGLATPHKVIDVPTLNHLYNVHRDEETDCLNPGLVHDFSISLSNTVTDVVSKNRFVFVLGGDCSVLIGIMSGLKTIGTYGLVFIDAHADFYEPEKSTTGQTADMDLALVTGRGPRILTNINNLHPYVQDENVVHIGQRDWEETQKYGSQDIKETAITCFDLKLIRQQGIDAATNKILKHIHSISVEGLWIHFDTDVLDDAINPAVDYRLPGGLSFHEAEYVLKQLLDTGKIAGISVTIYNPALDKDGSIGKNITTMLLNALVNTD